MKVRDLQLYLRYSLSKDILLSFVRGNFLGLILIFVIVNVIDYYDYFEKDEMLYLALTGIILLFSLVVFDRLAPVVVVINLLTRRLYTNEI